MKKQLFLLATIPMILLSSCGTSTQIADYNHYLVAAKSADVEAEKVTLTKKTVDGAGKIFYKDNTYTFTLHEEYNLIDDKFVRDIFAGKYECENQDVFNSISIYVTLMLVLKASTCGGDNKYLYTINPLSVTTKSEKMTFDKYGYMTAAKISDDNGTDYTLNAAYTYQA